MIRFKSVTVHRIRSDFYAVRGCPVDVTGGPIELATADSLEAVIAECLSGVEGVDARTAFHFYFIPER